MAVCPHFLIYGCRLFSFFFELGDSPLYNLDRRAATPSSQPANNMLSLDLSTPTHNLQQQEQVQLVDGNNQYIESRSTAIESIESTLHELGGIFQQLAQMVSEQRDMVQRYEGAGMKHRGQTTVLSGHGPKMSTSASPFFVVGALTSQNFDDLSSNVSFPFLVV